MELGIVFAIAFAAIGFVIMPLVRKSEVATVRMTEEQLNAYFDNPRVNKKYRLKKK